MQCWELLLSGEDDIALAVSTDHYQVFPFCSTSRNIVRDRYCSVYSIRTTRGSTAFLVAMPTAHLLETYMQSMN